MKTLTEAQYRELSEILGDHLSLDLVSLQANTQDSRRVPPVMRPLLGDTTPAVIAEPETERQLQALVEFATRYRLPITPRGRATSNYGGVLSTRGGLVVTFERMQRLTHFHLGDSPADFSATVEPGITWNRLEHELAAAGLALRLYPSSALESTVGGWLAQGGAGFGSYEYGYLGENVVSARVVLPSARVWTFGGDDLQFVDSAEGITGLISQVELRIRPQEPTEVAACAFSTPEALQAGLEALAAARVPLWSVTLMDPRLARLQNGLAAQGNLPEAYLALFAWLAGRRGLVVPGLDRACTALGQMVQPESAQAEWHRRLHSWRSRFLGTPLMPVQVVVPLKHLALLLGRLEEQLQPALAWEGTVIRGAEVALTGLPATEAEATNAQRTYGQGLAAIRLGQELGGRAYATGFFFAHERDNALGADRVQRLIDYKLAIDEFGLMNPDKVIVTTPLNWALSHASVADLLARLFAKHPTNPERSEKLTHGGETTDQNGLARTDDL